MMWQCRNAVAFMVGPILRTPLPSSCVRGMHGSLRTTQLLLPTSVSQGLLLTISRHLSSIKFNRNLEFFSADDKPLPKKMNSFCVSPENGSPEERPLTLLMCWLMSKDSHVKKFVDLYNEMGFDVLKIRISPFDMLRPVKGAQVVAGQMLEFLHQNPRHSSVLVHGFSVGVYVFCEGLVQMSNNMELHAPVLNRFVGQIWDSPVDVHGIPVGTSKAVTNNQILQTSIKKYLDWFLRNQYDVATVHYEAASVKMHNCFLGVPGLFFLSKTDPVATPAMISDVYENWESMGIPISVKIFDKSPHVSHFARYKKEYVEEVVTFLQHLHLLESGKKRAAA
uniref:Transmembrane protein 53-like n=1 Tax=Hirondellea gigas TaxID=1518452 RepID=A0A2P2I707_9CRUS